MTDREAMQLALEALEETSGGYSRNIIAALRERLAQPEHKPTHPTLQKMWEGYFDKCYKREPEQEPVVWVLPKIHPVMELRAQRGFRVR